MRKNAGYAEPLSGFIEMSIRKPVMNVVHGYFTGQGRKRAPIGKQPAIFVWTRVSWNIRSRRMDTYTAM